MKQVIDGKLYDTEKAKELGEASFGHSSDFQHWQEKLYRTKSGAYFLWGEGGPMTRYAVRTGNNMTSGSSRIEPLSKAEALAWCEENNLADVAVSEFADLVVEA